MTEWHVIDYDQDNPKHQKHNNEQLIIQLHELQKLINDMNQRFNQITSLCYELKTGLKELKSDICTMKGHLSNGNKISGNVQVERSPLVSSDTTLSTLSTLTTTPNNIPPHLFHGQLTMNNAMFPFLNTLPWSNIRNNNKIFRTTLSQHNFKK